MLGKANVEGAMKINTLQDLLKSTLARAEWMREGGGKRIADARRAILAVYHPDRAGRDVHYL
jgi:hypothetical protein